MSITIELTLAQANGLLSVLDDGVWWNKKCIDELNPADEDYKYDVTERKRILRMAIKAEGIIEKATKKEK